MTTATVTIGILAGSLAAILWNRSARWLSDETFWPAVLAASRKLATADIDDFVSEYIAVLRALVAYTCKTGCRVAITIAPVCLTLIAFSPMLSNWQRERATSLIIHPPQPVTLQSADGILTAQAGEYGRIGDATELTLHTAEWQTDLSCTTPVIVTNSWLTNALGLAAGFTTVVDENAPAFLLIRAGGPDGNPLWPYLSDHEGLFWLSLVVASVVTGLLAARWSTSGTHHAQVASMSSSTVTS